jgi:uncharacterized protein YbjT (DUF2867 family)
MEADIRKNKPLVLLTGATGYIGGRLLSRLLREGHSVRCAARHPENLFCAGDSCVEVVKADLLDYPSVEAALENVDAAYYLAHSLGSTVDFERKERLCAENFARAAKKKGVARIVYLGGLGAGENLSPHLRTRQEVGRVLRESGVKTVELRASIIIGSGSLSFEMVRALVDRLPVMITPRWVGAKTQPIAIEDVLDYLIAALDIELDNSAVFEIGGPDAVSYLDIMREYARQRGLYRYMIPVPVLTPRLSSLWLGLVTPLYARVGRKLIDSIRNDTLVQNQDSRKRFPIQPRDLSDAISRALKNEDKEFAETRWSDALSSSGDSPSWGGVRFGSRIIDSRSAVVSCSTEQVFAKIQSIGGNTGWYYANWAWSLRGFIDLLVGGVGTRRGRSNPDGVAVGDTIDFWRVEAVKSNELLRLRAEMKLPGRAWLQFEVVGDGERSLIRQTAIFDPLGVFGQLYWYGLYPIHRLIFRGMLKGIIKASLQSRQEGKGDHKGNSVE